MKFLLIINNDIDGIGQPAINLCKNLNKSGHDAKVLVLHKSKNYSKIIKLKRNLTMRIFLYLLNFIKKDLIELFGFGFGTVDYNNMKEYIDEADVIIIFTFYKILSNKILNKILLLNKTVYFRPLDIEMASGGCHFNKFCQKYKNNCSDCPKIYLPKIFNFAKRNLLEKERIFNKHKPKILVQNNYVKKIFKESKIFKKLDIKPFFISVNPKRAKNYKKKFSRKYFNFGKNDKIILFGAFDLSSYIKGWHLLKKSLIFLDKKIENKNCKIKFVTFGNKNNINIDLKNIEWKHLGLIKNNKELNLIYRSADVLSCPSLFCFGPHIVSEAAINNLPIVAYDLGVAKDHIKNGFNGYLVECHNVQKFADAIYKSLFSLKNFKVKSVLKKNNLLCSSNSEVKFIIKEVMSDVKKN